MIIYVIISIITLGVLHTVAATEFWSGRLKNSLTGGATGLGSYSILDGMSSTESFLVSAYNGAFGIFGFIMLIGLASLLGVWTWNLFTTRRYLVV